VDGFIVSTFFDIPSVLSRLCLNHPATMPPLYPVRYLTKNPYHHAEDRGPVFEVSPSADQPPGRLRTCVSATPRRRGFALFGIYFSAIKSFILL
jgi:hypothetical protein